MKKKFILLTALTLLSLPIFAQNIFKAAQSNDIAGIKFLLNYGVNINARNNQGATPLLVAVKSGNEKAADFLIEKDADINLQDNTGSTALIAAINADNKALVKKLVEHGADAKLADKKNKNAVDYANLSKDSAIKSLLSI